MNAPPSASSKPAPGAAPSGTAPVSYTHLDVYKRQTQQSTLRHHAVGRFADLAPAMLVDPAILVWLDGRRNTRRSPNENLAREFFEMFTLGQGIAYTESDVRESARALTGWTITCLLYTSRCV